jgi:hypothetical protein
MERFFIKKKRTRSLLAINSLLQILAEAISYFLTVLLKKNHRIPRFIDFGIGLKLKWLTMKRAGYFLKV